MLRDAFRRLDRAYPWLSACLGGRLDVQLPAISVSLLTHAVLLALFGMLTYPWLAAAVPGALVLARRQPVVAGLSVWAVLSFLWLNASITPWDGGWAAGPRYLVPVLPFLSLLAGAAVLAGVPRKTDRRAVARLRTASLCLLAALVLISVANMFAATAVKPELPKPPKDGTPIS